VDDYFNQFITTYIDPVYNNSEILLQRKRIRASKKLNSLLLNNKVLLGKVYHDFQAKNREFDKNVSSLEQLLNSIDE
jgi:hypothetical protein